MIIRTIGMMRMIIRLEKQKDNVKKKKEKKKESWCGKIGTYPVGMFSSGDEYTGEGDMEFKRSWLVLVAERFCISHGNFKVD